MILIFWDFSVLPFVFDYFLVFRHFRDGDASNWAQVAWRDWLMFQICNRYARLQNFFLMLYFSGDRGKIFWTKFVLPGLFGSFSGWLLIYYSSRRKSGNYSYGRSSIKFLSFFIKKTVFGLFQVIELLVTKLRDRINERAITDHDPVSCLELCTYFTSSLSSVPGLSINCISSRLIFNLECLFKTLRPQFSTKMY